MDYFNQEIVTMALIYQAMNESHRYWVGTEVLKQTIHRQQQCIVVFRSSFGKSESSRKALEGSCFRAHRNFDNKYQISMMTQCPDWTHQSRWFQWCSPRKILFNFTVRSKTTFGLTILHSIKAQTRLRATMNHGGDLGTEMDGTPKQGFMTSRCTRWHA